MDPQETSPETPTRPVTAPENAQRYGHVRVQRPLGAGGMGEVLLGIHEGLQVPVVVKLLPLHLDREGYVERFLREAQVAVRLEHANIVRVYDVGREHGRAYMVLEYVEGQDLDAYAKACGGRLPAAEALRVVGQAAQGLAYAHAQGVMHRDIKPSNLVRRTKDGVVKVVDFGLARAADSEQLTSPDAVMGTLPFMAFEQLDGHAVPASDVYALGVSLYRLLTGRLPATGDLAEMIRFHEKGSVRPVSEAQAVPQEVESLVQKMLSRRAEDRPSAAAVAAEIDAILPQVGSEPRRGTPALVADVFADAQTKPLPARRRRVLSMAASAAAVLAVIGLYFALQKGPKGAKSPLPRGGATVRASEASTAVLIRPRVLRSFAKKAMLGQKLAPSGAASFEEGEIRSGEGVRFALLADGPRYVYVFGVDTGGAATCLFPDVFAALFADELKEGTASGEAAQNPLAPDARTLYVPPIVSGRQGAPETRWFQADESVGKEWFLIAAAEQPIEELETLRKAPDLATSAERLRTLAAQWQGAQSGGSSPDELTVQHFPEERLVAPGLSSARGPGCVVWTVTLDHKR